MNGRMLEETLHVELIDTFRTALQQAANREKRVIEKDAFPLVLEDNVQINYYTIAGYEKSDPEIGVYVLQPKQQNDSLPAILAIHGGGYMVGDALMDLDAMCQDVLRYHCVIVSPEYRLSGTAPYPAALHDCYAALLWMYHHATQLGIDKNNISVFGNSAGGGLAAALAILARDLQEVPIAAQFLIAPMLDYRNDTASSYEIQSKDYVWHRGLNQFAWKQYLGTLADEQITEYASPALLKEFQQLPPALIIVGTADLFRDEAIQYANALMQANVPTELHVLQGVPHGMSLFEEQGVILRFWETARVLIDNMLHKKSF